MNMMPFLGLSPFYLAFDLLLDNPHLVCLIHSGTPASLPSLQRAVVSGCQGQDKQGWIHPRLSSKQGMGHS